MKETDLKKQKTFREYPDDGCWYDLEFNFQIRFNMGQCVLSHYCEVEGGTWFIKNIKGLEDLKRVYEAITDQKFEIINEENLYYIQTSGFVGDAMLWWKPEGKGYTTEIDKAGKFTEEEMRSIINNRPAEDFGWECDYIDNYPEAVVKVVYPHMGYDKRIKGVGRF